MCHTNPFMKKVAVKKERKPCSCQNERPKKTEPKYKYKSFEKITTINNIRIV